MNNNKRPYVRGGAHRMRNPRYDDARPDPYFLDAEAARNRPAGDGLVWKKIDMHLHTPASSDYRDPGISYLDILKKAEEKNLDMIAFADHNTVSGYAAMHKEVETLSLLENLGRISPAEQSTLNEYRRLLAKINVLPAFEFTATFGFHILGIFPEGTSIRKLEYLLLNLNVPEERMLRGAPDVGSTSDVLNAYASITAAGGMAIAAHANSSNGVAMQGFPFGGQTKIAYTQDPNLVCLEVTDLEQTGRRTTAAFYNGIKTEYPRRMHCIQGSDAHSLETEQSDANNKRLGVGARITEVLMRDATFASLKEVLTGEDFTRVRPYRSNKAWEMLEAARAKGPNQIVAFHERAYHALHKTKPVLQDVVAFANGYGGMIYIGASPDTNVPLQGLEHPEETIRLLRDEVHKAVEPQLDVNFDIKPNGDRSVIVMNVPGGDNRPYIYSPTSQIYIRDGGLSILATRDEMIKLIIDAAKAHGLLAESAAADQARAASQASQAAPTAPVQVPAVPVPAVPLIPTAIPVGEAVSAPPVQASNIQQRQTQGRTWRERRDERLAVSREAPKAAQDETTPDTASAPVSAAQSAQSASATSPNSTVQEAVPSEGRTANAPQLDEQRKQLLARERLSGGKRTDPAEAGRLAAPAAVGRPSVRPPALRELPPERIKGQIQPMSSRSAPTQAQANGVPEADEIAQYPTESAVQPETGVTAEVAQSNELAGSATEESASQPVETTRGGRRRGTRGRQAEQAGEATEAPEPDASPTQEAEVPAKAGRSGRGRSRRRTEEAAEPLTVEAADVGLGSMPAQSEQPTETAAPMEATVSAEHLTRAEIVEAEAAEPKRGRGRRRTGRTAAEERELEITAPTAAAAATEAGAEALLTEADTEPGPQTANSVDEPVVPITPAKRGRSRRKTEAERAAEADAEAGGEAQPEQPAQAAQPAETAQGPTTGNRRRRGGKREAASASAAPVLGAKEDAGGEELVPLPEGTPENEPPEPPSTGVEIIDTVAGQRATSHTMRDMRNGQTVRNVTRQSARRLWHYAIVQHERGNPELSEVLWHESQPIGLWRRGERAGALRYDLVSRYPDGSLRVFYGVTDEGITGPWRNLVDQAEAVGYVGPDAPGD